MKGFKLALLLLILLPWYSADAQVIFPNRGGTGTTTIPSAGQVLVGQSNGTYGPQATSTLGISGSTFATSSIDTEAKLEAILTDVTNLITNNDSTSNLTEGSNLYYTIGRVQSALVAGYNAILGNSTTTNATTTNLAVTGSFNLLGTVITNVSTWFSGLFDTNFAGKDTDDLTEGSSLYYTDQRARDAISETVTGLDYSSSTGALSLTSGHVIPTSASTTDWQTAYSWGDHADEGYLTVVPTSTVRNMLSAASPLAYNAGTGQFTFSNPGYITGVDWGDIGGTLSAQTDLQAALDAKLSTSSAAATYYPLANPAGYTNSTGTVTSVGLSTPTGLSVSGSPVTNSGTLALSWAAGYGPVLTASTTEWHNFHTTPSGRITAGTGIDWSGNTLNVTVVDTNTTYTAGDGLTLTGTDLDFDGGASPAGDLGGTWASPTVDDVTCTNCLNAAEIEDIYLLNSGDTATGDYNFDSGTLFVDSTNNRAGIGTASPARLLHVSGSMPTLRLTDSDTSADSEVHADSSVGSINIAADINNALAGSAINFFIDGAQKAILTSAGRLGIGTTTPSYDLAVAGNMFLTGAFRDSTESVGTAGMVLQSTGSATRWVATSSLGISGGGGSSDTNWTYLASDDQVATASSTSGIRAAYVTATSTATSTFVGPVQIGSTAGNNLFKITANTDYSASNSVGGAFNLNCTNNTGSCFVAYTNAASSNGNLFGIRVDDPGFLHSAFRIDYDGAGDAFTAVGTASTSNAISASNAGVDHTINSAYTGTSANKGAGNFTSTNPNGSTLQITGVEDGLAALKVNQNSSSGSADSAVANFTQNDPNGQGVFIECGTTSGYSGTCLNFRIDGSEFLTASSTGYIGIGDSSPTSLLTVGAGDAFQVNSSGQVVAGTWAGSDIDISDYTNLAGDTEIVLTGDTLSIASSIARDSELPDALSDLSFDVGSVDTTEFGYLNGVTSAIQTQLSGKFGTAGRSLTSSGVTVDADAELYTDTKCIYFEDPTAGDDFKSIWANKSAGNYTITEIWGESDQTVAFDLQIDDGTPADVNGTDISPAAGEAEDTSLSGDTTLAAGEELDLAITSVTNTPTWLSVCWTYTKND